MTRGDTLSFGVRLKGLTQDLDSAYFTVETPEPYNFVVVQKSLDDGITKNVDNTDCLEYIVRVAPEDTAELNVDKYNYDLEIGVDDDIFTPFKGILYLEHDSTRHEVSE